MVKTYHLALLLQSDRVGHLAIAGTAIFAGARLSGYVSLVEETRKSAELVVVEAAVVLVLVVAAGGLIDVPSRITMVLVEASGFGSATALTERLAITGSGGMSSFVVVGVRCVRCRAHTSFEVREV